MTVFTDADKFKWSEGLKWAEYLMHGEITRGVGDGRYDPQTPVTREQMAMFLGRLANWPALAADELKDSSVFLALYTHTNKVGCGSGWWRAPRLVYTNKHVGVEQYTHADGTPAEVPHDMLMLANGGWVRSDRSPTGDPTFYVAWDKTYPVDLAAIIVPTTLWQRYLAARQAAGLPREPRYINPHDSREIVAGEPVAVCGSPLMYDFTATAGNVAKVQVVRTERDLGVEYVMVTAGINPGNSGGVCLTLDRRLVGIPSLKPWANTSFGMTHGDDLGLVLHWSEIVKWEQRLKPLFDAQGIDLAATGA